MAITSVGYDGQIDEAQWATLTQYLGTPYAVGGANDLAVSIQVGADRTVRLAPGTAYGHGVIVTSDSQVTVQLPVIASGSRWDLIVLRRNWQPTPGGTSTFTYVTGSTARVLPARLSSPGVQDEQPLALVQVTAGQSAPTGLVDLRVWPTKVLTATDLLAVSDAGLGAEAVVAGFRYRRELDATSNLAWVRDRSVSAGLSFTPAVAAAVLTPTTGWSIAGALVNRGLRMGNTVQVDLELSRTGAAWDPNTAVGSAAIVGTLTVPYRPERSTPCPLVYFNASRASFGGVMQVDATGNLQVIAGTSGQTVGQVAAGTVSIRASCIFLLSAVS